MSRHRKPLSIDQIGAMLARRPYQVPDTQTAIIDAEIGRFFSGTGKYRTQEALIKGLGIDEKTFRQREMVVAGVLERQLERDVRRALYALGKATVTKRHEKFRRQNLETSRTIFGKALENNPKHRGRIVLAKRIIKKNADLFPAQFNEKLIPLIRRILGV